VGTAYADTPPNHHDFYQENNPRTDTFVGFFIAGYKPASAVFTEEVLFPLFFFRFGICFGCGNEGK
jgi:hypothetical protein